MTVSDDIYSSFLQCVKGWTYSLRSMIMEIIDRGATPVLIALSRKMPRFVNWIKQTHIEGLISNNDVNVIESVELTTELALPFIFFESDLKKMEFIIIDDFMVHGSTIRNVASDIELLTDSKCHLSCIFRLNITERPSNIDIVDFDRIISVKQDLADIYIEYIANIVEKSQLPIDMEFPIFKFTNTPEYNFQYIKDLSDKSDIESYFIGNKDTKFSINIPNSYKSDKTCDFSKVRYFNDEKNTIIEVLSPHILSFEELLSLNDNLFSSPKYQEIWTISTEKIRCFLNRIDIDEAAAWDSLKSNFVRSLCVWANYLFSISTFANAKDIILPNFQNRELSLCKHDLGLILGAYMTECIYSSIVNLYNSCNINLNIKDSVLDIPSKFAPKFFLDDMESNTFLACLLQSNVSNALIDIFNYQHYTNPVFSNPLLKKERIFFGESYESLYASLYPFFTINAILIEINIWIDDNIDKGYVIPKYEKVVSKSGTTYWKRFFHAGIRRYQRSDV